MLGHYQGQTPLKRAMGRFFGCGARPFAHIVLLYLSRATARILRCLVRAHQDLFYPGPRRVTTLDDSLHFLFVLPGEDLGFSAWPIEWGWKRAIVCEGASTAIFEGR